MIKTLIDASRANALYIGGVGVLMLLSLALSNLPGIAVSNYFDFAYRRHVCGLLFMIGACWGAFAGHSHLERVKTPWKIPQSRVAISYAVFFTTTFVAILLAR